MATSEAKRGGGLVESGTALGAVTSRNIDHATPELFAAMVAAEKAIGNARKSGENRHDRYQYATLEDYLDATRAPCLENNLLLVTDLVGEPVLCERKTARGGTMYVVRQLVNVTVIHAESKGWLAVQAWGEGQDVGDKAFYKAITGARKYALAMLFNIYTTDDAEEDSHPESTASPAPRSPQPKPAPAPAPAAPSAPTSPHTAEEWATLLERLKGLSSDDKSSAADKLKRAASYFAESDRLADQPERLSEARLAISGRADELISAGQISKEQAVVALKPLIPGLVADPAATPAPQPQQSEAPGE